MLFRFIEKVEKSNNAAASESANADSLNNPVDAFLTIKQLVENWNDVKYFMKSDKSAEFKQNVTTSRHTNSIQRPTEVIGFPNFSFLSLLKFPRYSTTTDI